MKDSDCVQFLQWALPRLHLRWPGFRKVRGQVCKRISNRLQTLKLGSTSEYHRYLESHPDEWQVLDGLCRVTISRFYREKRVFQFLEREVLPTLLRMLQAKGETQLNILTLGSASGEEPYTLAILWWLQLKDRFPAVSLVMTATEADPNLIERSERACYPYSSIRNLPSLWLDQVFVEHDEQFCLRELYREGVRFLQEDIRDGIPGGPYDLILCRNLAFTYFDNEIQREILRGINQALKPGGALILGIHETLPAGAIQLIPWSEKLRVYQKTV